MKFKTYSNKNKPVFVYIHGECLSAFSFKEEIKELKKDFQVVLPILDGHDVTADEKFIDIDTCAKYSLQGTTQGNGLTGGVPPVRFSM